ncbi:MAG TPA: hypothetical protein VGN16_05535 [Acidobacteriaceae bacterium]|jgi:hypothetical protein
MPTNRRQFLAASTLSVIATALPKSLLAQQSGNSGVFTNGNLGAYQQGLINLPMFQNMVGETFTLFVDDTNVAYLRLTRVIDHTAEKAAAAAKRLARTASAGLAHGSALGFAGTSTAPKVSPADVLDPVNASMISFSLIFASSGAPFTQDSYTVDSPRLGRFVMFTVPNSSQSACASFGQLMVNTPRVVFPPIHGGPVAL